MAILGIDEVGRGPLAGPLVVGAVILPEYLPYPRFDWMLELRDSKKLTAKKREELSDVIMTRAKATGLGWVSSQEIDEIGIGKALRLATRRAVTAIRERHEPFSQIIIDGKVNFLSETTLGQYVSTMPKADDLVKEVSAASIIAKVARDKYMVELAKKYPEYGFEKHMGYGTAFHREAIERLGICPEHRKSFEPCRSICGFDEMNNAGDEDASCENTTEIGKIAEQKVAEYLEKHDHMIIARNFKNKYCEIDIVSVNMATMKLCFTEVKYRKDNARGGGLGAVDKKKRDQMKFAAEVFLKKNSGFREYDLLLTVAVVSGKDFEVDDWFAFGFDD